MKPTIIRLGILLTVLGALCFVLGLSTAAFGQTVPKTVQKATGTNYITEDLVFNAKILTVNTALVFGDGVRQTFNPDATNAGLNVGAHTADPSSLSNGDLWYDSTANELTARINGATVALGGSGDLTANTIWDTKGDLLVGTGSNTAAKLPAGVNGLTLVTDSAEATGLKWAVAGGAPTDAKYILQTADGTLSAEQALSALATGIVQVTTTTGVLSSVTTSVGVSNLLSDETGTGGVLVFNSNPGITSASLTTPSVTTYLTLGVSATPTTTGSGRIQVDSNAWASSRGAIQAYDGTSDTYLVGTLTSDTPTSGQVPRWVPNGTVLWDTPANINGVTTSAIAGAKTYSSDGDTNGVFYFLGTDLGTSPWTNPQTGSRLVATRSSDASGTVVDITDRTTNTTYSNTESNAWVYFDIGSSKTLVVDKYSMRADSSGNRYPRTWKLQGSASVASSSIANVNAATWVDIDARASDTTLDTSGEWYTLTANQGNTNAYRYFRLIQTGVESFGGLYFTFAEAELYGTLTYTGPGGQNTQIAIFDGLGTNVKNSSLTASGATLSTSVTNGNITVSPDGTGYVSLTGKALLPTQTPASASATGVAGQIAWDASYIYVCTATDTWKRVAIATW